MAPKRERKQGLGFKADCGMCGKKNTWIHGIAWDWNACKDCWDDLEECARPRKRAGDDDE